MIRSGILVLLGAMLSACSQPKLRADARSDNPQERSLALARIFRDGDRDRILDLIRLLESPDPVDRMLSIRILEDWTGQILGYEPMAPDAERAAAVDRWWTWAEEEGFWADE